MRHQVEEFISRVKNLKKERGFKVIDAHCHSHDVMGVVHYSDDVYNNDLKEARWLPSFGDRLRFSFFGNLVSNGVMQFVPQVARADILSTFSKKNLNILGQELDSQGLDNIVLLSLYPWVDPYTVKKTYDNSRFLLLGSVDLHKIKENDIAPEIRKQKKELGIVGIKLHPNLQDFFPQPSYNSPELASKLEAIYKTAEEEGLYLLFHGGTSSFTKKINPKYQEYSRSRTKGILNHFIDSQGNSELLGKYNTPIIIAHLGHFGLNLFDFETFELLRKFDNLYFDTAAVSPKMILQALRLVGPERIILGSDAFYNLPAYAMYFIGQAVSKLGLNRKNEDDYLEKILGRNYFDKIYKN